MVDMKLYELREEKEKKQRAKIRTQGLGIPNVREEYKLLLKGEGVKEEGARERFFIFIFYFSIKRIKGKVG